MCIAAVCFWRNRSHLTWTVHYMSANKNYVRKDTCSFREWEELSLATVRLYIYIYVIPTLYSKQSQCWSLRRYGTPAILSHQKPWLLTYVCFPFPQDWSRFNKKALISLFSNAFKSNFIWFTNNKLYHMDISFIRCSNSLECWLA